MHVDPISTIPFSGPMFGTESLTQAGMKCAHVESGDVYRLVEWLEWPSLYFVLCNECAKKIISTDAIISAPIRKGIVN